MIQVAIFQGSDEEYVESKVNKWLTSREAQRYDIQEIKHSSTGIGYSHSSSVYITVMITYDDEPHVTTIYPNGTPRPEPNPTPLR